MTLWQFPSTAGRCGRFGRLASFEPFCHGCVDEVLQGHVQYLLSLFRRNVEWGYKYSTWASSNNLIGWQMAWRPAPGLLGQVDAYACMHAYACMGLWQSVRERGRGVEAIIDGGGKVAGTCWIPYHGFCPGPSHPTTQKTVVCQRPLSLVYHR